MSKIETTLRKRNAAVSALRDCYSSAKFYFPTSQEMNRQVLDIKAKHLGRSPLWARAFFEGVADELVKSLYRERLVYGGYVGDTFYSTYRARPDYYEKHGIEPSDYADNGRVKARGHYWTDESGKVTKPYFADAKEESENVEI